MICAKLVQRWMIRIIINISLKAISWFFFLYAFGIYQWFTHLWQTKELRKCFLIGVVDTHPKFSATSALNTPHWPRFLHASLDNILPFGITNCCPTASLFTCAKYTNHNPICECKQLTLKLSIATESFQSLLAVCVEPWTDGQREENVPPQSRQHWASIFHSACADNLHSLVRGVFSRLRELSWEGRRELAHSHRPDISNVLLEWIYWHSTKRFLTLWYLISWFSWFNLKQVPIMDPPP